MSLNSIPPYLRMTEPTAFRQPTVSATIANSVHGALQLHSIQPGLTVRPRRAKSDCPTPGDRGVALTLGLSDALWLNRRRPL